MRSLRNAIGRTKGYSGCYRCGDSWSFKKPHMTPYGDGGRACFPLCEECWQATTPAERGTYYEQLWVVWQEQAALFPPDVRRTWDKEYSSEVHEQILNAVSAGA